VVFVRDDAVDRYPILSSAFDAYVFASVQVEPCLEFPQARGEGGEARRLRLVHNPIHDFGNDGNDESFVDIHAAYIGAYDLHGSSRVLFSGVVCHPAFLLARVSGYPKISLQALHCK